MCTKGCAIIQVETRLKDITNVKKQAFKKRNECKVKINAKSQKRRKKYYQNKMKSLLSDVIEQNIEFSLGEIPLLPLIVFPPSLVQHYIGFDNVIILNNA